MSEDRPDCFGTKRCPKGPKNASRAFCPLYTLCIDELIAQELGRTNSIVRTMKVLRTALCDADGFGLSDYMMLTRIGEVAVRNGYRYGRKKVDRAINLSNIDEDGECASAEKSFVRAVFGVYGRKTSRIGQTSSADLPADNDEPPDGSLTEGDDVAAVRTRKLRHPLAVVGEDNAYEAETSRVV